MHTSLGCPSVKEKEVQGWSQSRKDSEDSSRVDSVAISTFTANALLRRQISLTGEFRLDDATQAPEREFIPPPTEELECADKIATQ
jgi:hypothetical protein